MLFTAFSTRSCREESKRSGEDDDENLQYTVEDVNCAMKEMLDQRPQETYQDKEDADRRRTNAQRHQGQGKGNANEAKQEVHAHATVQEENQGDSGDGNDAMGAKEEEEGETKENAEHSGNGQCGQAPPHEVEKFEQALGEMNYELKEAHDVLNGIVENGEYPDDLMSKVMELTSMTEAQIKNAVGPKARQMLESLKEALKQEQDRRAREKALKDAQKKIEKEKERIRKIKEEEERRKKALAEALKKKKAEEARQLKEQLAKLAAERKELERLQRERNERQRKERDAQRKDAQRQEKLKTIGRCSAGYAWVHEGGGFYRCSAGGHTHQFND